MHEAQKLHVPRSSVPLRNCGTRWLFPTFAQVVRETAEELFER
jgi:hypothetical protein